MSEIAWLSFLSCVTEAHPDMIQSDGFASQEAYANDLAYLKRKVPNACFTIDLLFIDLEINLG